MSIPLKPDMKVEELFEQIVSSHDLGMCERHSPTVTYALHTHNQAKII